MRTPCVLRIGEIAMRGSSFPERLCQGRVGLFGGIATCLGGWVINRWVLGEAIGMRGVGECM